jgi:hypothetical protein
MVPPGVSVALPITKFEAELAVIVVPPTVNIAAGVLTTGTLEVWMPCVAPLMITADPVAGRTNVVGDAPPEPGTITVPPGVSVELPMTKFDCEFPIIVVPPAVIIGATVIAGEVGNAVFA